jgi:hypothetical protein
MLSQLFRSRYTTNTIASRKSPCVMDMCSHAPSCIWSTFRSLHPLLGVG